MKTDRTTTSTAGLGAHAGTAGVRKQWPRKGSTENTARGRVWLVGAGPGDAELLTLKALRVLRQCEVWLVDDLVGRDILELARPGTRIIEVGKRGGCASTPQEFILRLMERYARQGRTVARVKGGDPFIFGRAGEEIAWLESRGIEAQSVSGITAGLAAAGALGLPLTHRAVARGVTLVTAHTADGERPDWQALARSGLTVVCYMGMSQPAALAREWLAAGFAASLPVAVVQHVSCENQRYALTTLEQMAAAIEARGLASPAIIVMGEAVRQARCWAQEPADEPDAAPLELESTARIDEPGEKAGTVG